ncbi:MAG: molybdenum cofactor guanylyltransferase [Prolixibacteraceae bacterium]|nr:molybdenum cofactor guanylyltransferase [Prolixibacteraceae bacterium]
MKIKADISGFILAGGKSNRMGTDKALLLVQEETLLIRIKNLIGPFCKTVEISGYKSDYSDFNIKMIPDLYPGIGPVSGLISTLKHSSTEWNLLVSVDTPFINKELIQSLITQIGEFDCIIPEHDGGMEPLIGLYNRKILPQLEEVINQGDYKLQRLVAKLNTRYLDCRPLIQKYPRLFFNINRPEDYNSI